MRQRDVCVEADHSLSYYVIPAVSIFTPWRLQEGTANIAAPPRGTMGAVAEVWRRNTPPATSAASVASMRIVGRPAVAGGAPAPTWSLEFPSLDACDSLATALAVQADTRTLLAARGHDYRRLQPRQLFDLHMGVMTHHRGAPALWAGDGRALLEARRAQAAEERAVMVALVVEREQLRVALSLRALERDVCPAPPRAAAADERVTRGNVSVSATAAAEVRGMEGEPVAGIIARQVAAFKTATTALRTGLQVSLTAQAAAMERGRAAAAARLRAWLIVVHALDWPSQCLPLPSSASGALLRMAAALDDDAGSHLAAVAALREVACLAAWAQATLNKEAATACTGARAARRAVLVWTAALRSSHDAQLARLAGLHANDHEPVERRQEAVSAVAELIRHAGAGPPRTLYTESALAPVDDHPAARAAALATANDAVMQRALQAALSVIDAQKAANEAAPAAALRDQGKLTSRGDRLHPLIHPQLFPLGAPLDGEIARINDGLAGVAAQLARDTARLPAYATARIARDAGATAESAQALMRSIRDTRRAAEALLVASVAGTSSTLGSLSADVSPPSERLEAGDDTISRGVDKLAGCCEGKLPTNAPQVAVLVAWLLQRYREGISGCRAELRAAVAAQSSTLAAVTARIDGDICSFEAALSLDRFAGTHYDGSAAQRAAEASIDSARSWLAGLSHSALAPVGPYAVSDLLGRARTAIEGTAIPRLRTFTAARIAFDAYVDRCVSSLRAALDGLERNDRHTHERQRDADATVERAAADIRGSGIGLTSGIVGVGVSSLLARVASAQAALRDALAQQRAKMATVRLQVETTTYAATHAFQAEMRSCHTSNIARSALQRWVGGRARTLEAEAGSAGRAAAATSYFAEELQGWAASTVAEATSHGRKHVDELEQAERRRQEEQERREDEERERIAAAERRRREAEERELREAEERRRHEEEGRERRRREEVERQRHEEEERERRRREQEDAHHHHHNGGHHHDGGNGGHHHDGGHHHGGGNKHNHGMDGDHHSGRGVHHREGHSHGSSRNGAH